MCNPLKESFWNDLWNNSPQKGTKQSPHQWLGQAVAKQTFHWVWILSGNYFPYVMPKIFLNQMFNTFFEILVDCWYSFWYKIWKNIQFTVQMATCDLLSIPIICEIGTDIKTLPILEEFKQSSRSGFGSQSRAISCQFLWNSFSNSY